MRDSHFPLLPLSFSKRRALTHKAVLVREWRKKTTAASFEWSPRTILKGWSETSLAKSPAFWERAWKNAVMRPANLNPRDRVWCYSFICGRLGYWTNTRMVFIRAPQKQSANETSVADLCSRLNFLFLFVKLVWFKNICPFQVLLGSDRNDRNTLRGTDLCSSLDKHDLRPVSWASRRRLRTFYRHDKRSLCYWKYWFSICLSVLIRYLQFLHAKFCAAVK